MTQRDLERLRNGEISEMPPPAITLPPTPDWEAIEDSLNQAVPNTDTVESQALALIASLQELQREFGERVAQALNDVASEIRAIRGESQRQIKKVRHEVEEIQKGYRRIE